MDKQKIENDSIVKFLRGISEHSSGNSKDGIRDDNKDEVHFRDFINLLINDKWIFISITSIMLILGLAKAMLDTPVYKLDALLQVEAAPNSLGNFETMEELLDKNLPIKAEVAIIKSRMVMGAAVEKLNLNVVAEPNYFSFFGKGIARRFAVNNPREIAPPLFGYSQYAWGGEELEIKFLDVPNDWLGRKLTLITGEKGHYRVAVGNKELDAEGIVKQILIRPIEGEEKPFRLFVSKIKARPGTHFSISKNTPLHAIKTLQKRFAVKELNEKMGILNFSMESETPVIAMHTVNMIADTYVRFNVEQKTGNAEKTLVFLQDQLIKVKSQLKSSTLELNEYRKDKGSINFNLETQGVLSTVIELKTQVTRLQQKKDELHRSFTSSHPSVVAIDKQIRRLQGQIFSLNKKIKDLPETQQDILRLTRNVEVDTQLYTGLLNQLQTIKVTKAGTVGDVKIIDYAVLPLTPFKPKKTLIVLIALFLGFLISLVASLIRKAMRQGVEDPKIIEKNLDLPVFATVPHSNFQRNLSKMFDNNEQSDFQSSKVLALLNTDDSAIESISSLRTTLHLSLEESKNVILICSPSPNDGKSFISINLAILLANSEKRVLLIDGDMRQGTLHQSLDVSRENGFSELLNSIEPREAIKTIEDVGIDFISTGAIPPNPSELLLRGRFGDLLEIFKESYDIVLIDSPPILAVSDSSIIGQKADASILIVKAGEHTLEDLQLCIQRFEQNHVSIKGVVMNNFYKASSSYGYEKYSYKSSTN